MIRYIINTAYFLILFGSQIKCQVKYTCNNQRIKYFYAQLLLELVRVSQKRTRQSNNMYYLYLLTNVIMGRIMRKVIFMDFFHES